jgi:hypothetical protein
LSFLIQTSSGMVKIIIGEAIELSQITNLSRDNTCPIYCATFNIMDLALHLRWADNLHRKGSKTQ